MNQKLRIHHPIKVIRIPQPIHILPIMIQQHRIRNSNICCRQYKHDSRREERYQLYSPDLDAFCVGVVVVEEENAGGEDV